MKIDHNNLDEFKSFIVDSDNNEIQKDELYDEKLNKNLDCTVEDLKLDLCEKNNL